MGDQTGIEWTDRPIIYSAPMVRVSWDGRKTMTRRLVSPSTCTVNGYRYSAKSSVWRGLKFDHPSVLVRQQSTAMRFFLGADAPLDLHLDVPFIHPDDEARGVRWEDEPVRYRVRPIIEPGDRLWVRETFVLENNCDYRGDWPLPSDGRPIKTVTGLDGDCDLIPHYRATEPEPHIVPDDREDEHDDRTRWTPPIHMPRWASRMTQIVTAVKIERLQEISEEDAKAEGADRLVMDDDGKFYLSDTGTYRTGFAGLWAHIHSPGSWDANPFVVALTFETHKVNIDAMPKDRPKDRP